MLPIASRKNDPESSHEAEAEITDSGKRVIQCRQVLAAVREDVGCTAVELSRLHSIDRYAVSRRTADLEDQGLIMKGMRRKCSINKRMMVTWYPRLDVDADQGELW